MINCAQTRSVPEIYNRYPAGSYQAGSEKKRVPAEVNRREILLRILVRREVWSYIILLLKAHLHLFENNGDNQRMVVAYYSTGACLSSTVD